MQTNETMHQDKYIEINNLSNPQKTFERLDDEFIDIMYPHNLTERSIIMLLDVNIDPDIEKDIVWLKQLLDTILPEIGETEYFLTPLNPKQPEE